MTLAQIASVFLRISLTTWASGSATLARLRDELVHGRGRLGLHEWTLAYAIARVTPGTNVLAFCAAAGWRLHGWAGAIAAAVALALPCGAGIVALTMAYDTGVLAPFMPGGSAAVVGVILGGGLLLLQPYLTRAQIVRTLAIAAGAFAALHWLSPVHILVAAAAVGYLWREP